MNEKQAIKFAIQSGIEVTDIIKHDDGRRELNVGKFTLRCKANGRLWSQEKRSRMDTLGEAIRIAALRQILAAK